MSRYTPTERIGVNATESITLKELGWIFREQPTSDMGIDAHIESVDEGDPTGKLLGVQIKTGKSHFTVKDDHLVYYGTLTHLDYWLSHSLPVIIVAHLPETGETFWAQVSASTIERTKTAWKITIPKNQQFSKFAATQLKRVFEGSEREIKSRNLALHVENMRYLQNGGRLVIYKEEWHNKSLGRGALDLIQINTDGSEQTIKDANFFYTGYTTKSLVEKLYPWAEVGIDKPYYDVNFCQSFYDVYSDAYIASNDVYPYAVAMGEISFYRLELKLNSIGNSFLALLDSLDHQT